MTPQRVDPHAACGQTPKDTQPANATVDAVSERRATKASVEGKVKNHTPKRIEEEIVRIPVYSRNSPQPCLDPPIQNCTMANCR